MAFQLDILAYNADPASWKRTIGPNLPITATYDQFILNIGDPKTRWTAQSTGLSAADVEITIIDITKVVGALTVAISYPNTVDFYHMLPSTTKQNVQQKLCVHSPVSAFQLHNYDMVKMPGVETRTGLGHQMCTDRNPNSYEVYNPIFATGQM